MDTPPPPLAVIFDVDGTLVDSVDLHARSWQEVLARFGYIQTFERVRGQIGKGGDELLKFFLSPADLKRDGKALEKARGELFKAEYMSRVRPFPAVRPLFERLLARGQRIALGTSGKVDELEHYKRMVGIADLAIEQTTYDDADRSKPHPDIFEAARAKLGTPPERTVVVGDTPYDAEAAGKAGMATVGVLCGGFSPESLRAAGCVALFADPADLLARLNESPLG